MGRLTGQALGEQDTKAALVSPVLRALGWNVEDVEQVRHEYRHRSSDRPVDYALLVGRVPHLFVEAKGRGENLADRRWAGQVVSYAAVAGVSWVALTDGDEWRLYNAHAPVDVEEKLLRQIRISDDPEAAAEALGYLARENITQAQDVLSALWEAERADRAVRQAVEDLFGAEPPAWFINALARRTNGLTRGQVRSALRRLRIRLDAPAESALREADTARSVEATEVKQGRRRRPTGEVGFAEIIMAGLIRPPLVLSKRYLGEELQAQVQSDGMVVYGGKPYGSPSTAASAARESVKGPPPDRAKWQTNGWTFWLFEDDGVPRPIDVLRQRYRARSAAELGAEDDST